MNHADFMFQRNNTNHKYDNRRSFVLQNHYVTSRWKYNQELEAQALNIIAADLQNQINNITSASGGNNPNEPITGIV